jgi:lipopolysaccharide/colanic/teichoic acid biosynthesis glycosyltransferase
MKPYRGKRIFDLIIVLATAPLWGACLLVTASLVYLRLGTPVLFRQRRLGRGEQPFEMVKFRTMTAARDATGALLPDEQRLTAFGRTLRSTSLDELPELLNVLRGEMSLVGPRPLLPQYLSRYSALHRRRHETPPGLTGLAQVSGRNAIGWAERFDLDVSYVDHASLLLDVQILWRTVRIVVRRDGVQTAQSGTMPEFTGYE